MGTKISRVDFLKYTAVGAAATLLPSAVMAAPKNPKQTSKTITLGFIGLGQQAINLMNGFIAMDEVRIVAGCDVYGVKRQRFEQRINNFYKTKGITNTYTNYIDYGDLLKREDIDAVVIATPDHWHAIIAVAAAKAGKDIYLEKPMTFTIKEGQEVVKAVRQNARILQVGSQQRSDSEFIHATSLVREGRLGKIYSIRVNVGAPPVPYNLPAEPVPADLDWNKWLGPLSTKIHYNNVLDPVITIDPEQNETYWGAWRLYKETGGGMTTDWGAHMFDVTQWALGKDRLGPSEIVPPGVNGRDYLTYIYDNGIVVEHRPFDEGKLGVKVFGENGWIQVCRGEFLTSNPEFKPTVKENTDLPYETKSSHLQKFIDSVKTRTDPNVPVEIGHSSCTMCTLGNIAMELGRSLTWNPIVQKFMNDDEANEKLHYKYRDGYSL